MQIDALGSADPDLDRFQMTVFHAAVARKNRFWASAGGFN
jgi:hypothetical protein